MSRRLAPAATAAVIGLIAAAPAHAGLFGSKRAAAPAPAETAPAATAPSQTQAPPPRKATSEERAAADRLDALARAAFWAREADVDPRDAEAGVKLARALRDLNRNDEAIAAAERVLVLQPANEEAMLEIARGHIARGKGFYAIDPAKKAAAAAPKDWRPLSLLGVAYDQVGRPEDARAAWAQALKLSPDNPSVLSNLALSWAAAGDAPQAETLLRKAVARPGATLQMRQNLALVLGLQGKTAEAERLIRDDLPPETAEKTLAWLKAGAGPSGRTWTSLQASQPAGN